MTEPVPFPSVPENNYRVGHAGALITCSIPWSTGGGITYTAHARNQAVAEYLTERFVVFAAHFPNDVAAAVFICDPVTGKTDKR